MDKSEYLQTADYRKRNAVAQAKAAAVLAATLRREERRENFFWALSLFIVWALGVAVWWFKTVAVGGAPTISFFIGLIIMWTFMVFGVWKINR